MSDRRRWYGLPFIALGVSLIIVDATIVNVAVPSIVDELKITSTDAQWVQEIYTLVFASLLLVFGRIADRFGRKRLFILGALAFALASIVAATAPTGLALILGRLLQGIGGAMMLPNSLSLLNSTFFGKERGIAFAIWGSTIGAAAAFGPLLGGWLTTDFSWRWAFGINLPFAAIVITGIALFIDESKAGDEREGADFLGAFMSVIGIGSIVFALIEGRNYGWWSAIKEPTVFGITWTLSISMIPVAFGFGLLVLAYFLRVETRRNERGMPVLLDLGLLRVQSFRNANIAAGIVSLGEFGLLFALPLWLQNVLGYSAFDAGKLLLSLAIGSFVASGIGAPLGAKRGPVMVVRTGILLEFIGLLAAGFIITSDTSWWAIAAPLFVYGMGVGLATAQLTGVALTHIPISESGQASGITSTTRQLGSALGIALLGTVLFSSLGSGLDTRLEGSPLPAAAKTAISEAIVQSAGSAIPAFEAKPGSEQVVTAAKDAFSEGTRYSAFAGAFFLFLGWLATLRLDGATPHREAPEEVPAAA